MKTSTKILTILAVATVVPTIFLFKYLLDAIVPTGTSFVVSMTPLGWVALAFLVASTIFVGILFFKLVQKQRLASALFLTIVPLTLVYGVFVAYVSSINEMTDITAQSIKTMMKISPGEQSQSAMLWVGLATVVYLLLLFVIIISLCSPLTKVEKVTKNLGDGRLKSDDFKVGGVKQFKEIENSLNKINFQYKQKENKLKQTDLQKQKNLSKQFFRFLGEEGLAELELGKHVKKTATLLLCDLECEKAKNKTLSLEENFNYINSYLKVVYPIIKRFNGFVDKFLGDGVLAVFSEPQEAILCAHALVKAIEVKNKGQKELLPIEAKIVVDTSEVVFGIVGEDDKKEPQIISEVLDNLKKMQETNAYIGTKMLVSKQALNSLPQNFEFDYRYTGVLEVDDKKIPLYESLETFGKRKKEKILKLKNNFEAGVRAYNQKKFKQAKQEFESVLHYMPDDTPAYVYFNKTLEKLKESA